MNIVIAGGGLVGLTAAASLRGIGHDVTVVEQAPEIRAAGAGIGLWENALRELDRIGIGATVRDLGQEVDLWFFDSRGRSVRAGGYAESDHRFLLVPRPQLNTLLAGVIGAENIVLGAQAIGYDETPAGVAVRLADGRSLHADLLIGADGAYSRIRERMLPGSEAQPHAGHYAWRAVVPRGDERTEGTILTVGGERTRGGYHRVGDEQTMWMVNQFAAGPLVGGKRDRALARAHHLADGGWHDELLRMIEKTPEDAILENEIMVVPPLPRWTSEHVALIGDAAHALSPHISAGGTLGIEDVGVLRSELETAPTLGDALRRYEGARMARFDRVRTLAYDVEQAADSAGYAESYAAFSHWMLTTSPSLIG